MPVEFRLTVVNRLGYFCRWVFWLLVSVFSPWRVWAASSLNQGSEPLTTKTHALLAAAALLQISVCVIAFAREFEWSFLADCMLLNISLSSYTGRIGRGRGS